MKPQVMTLIINGRTHYAALAPNVTLLKALRDLGYTDVKNGCEKGDCGSCAVLLDGQPINSCLTLAWQADGIPVLTPAGVGTLDHPHPLQEAFADLGAVQCGYCTGGLIIASKALLDQNPNPTDDEIKEAVSGNLCRCTGYGPIVEAVKVAAEKIRTRDTQAPEKGERNGRGDPATTDGNGGLVGAGSPRPAPGGAR